MKKILVATAVAGMLAIASFGFEEYYSYVNQLSNSINSRNDLYIGSIVDLNTNAVVGFAGCDERGYFVNLNTINSYNNYKKEVITVRYGFEEKDKLCEIMKTASSITTAPSITGEDGKVYEFGTEGYNGGKNCVAQYLDVTNDTLGVTIPVTNMVCYGIKPLNPLQEKPALEKYTGGKPSEYFKTNSNKILDWNDKNSDGINALFLDKEPELRGSYTTKEILDVALKSDTIGTAIDQDGVLLYVMDTDKNDKPVIYIGEKTISITDEMLSKAPGLKAAYEAYVEKTSAKYVIGCEDSIAIAEGTEGVPTGYIYGIVNGKKFIKHPVINNNAKSAYPYLCDIKMEGKEFTKEQFNLLSRAGYLLTKPVIIDENKQKEIDDDKAPATPVKVDNSPKGKVVALLKSADMPGLKIDEKGRYLGEVLTYGDGTAIMSLPNDEEIEYSIPADSELNKLGKDLREAVRDLDNQVYVYGCNIPLVEKPSKDTPEIGVVYVVYNGHAVSYIPAYINGSFKCNKNMVNKELSQTDYFKLYELVMNKAKKHPAFK